MQRAGSRPGNSRRRAGRCRCAGASPARRARRAPRGELEDDGAVGQGRVRRGRCGPATPPTRSQHAGSAEPLADLGPPFRRSPPGQGPSSRVAVAVEARSGSRRPGIASSSAQRGNRLAAARRRPARRPARGGGGPPRRSAGHAASGQSAATSGCAASAPGPRPIAAPPGQGHRVSERRGQGRGAVVGLPGRVVEEERDTRAGSGGGLVGSAGRTIFRSTASDRRWSATAVDPMSGAARLAGGRAASWARIRRTDPGLRKPGPGGDLGVGRPVALHRRSSRCGGGQSSASVAKRSSACSTWLGGDPRASATWPTSFDFISAPRPRPGGGSRSGRCGAV